MGPQAGNECDHGHHGQAIPGPQGSRSFRGVQEEVEVPFCVRRSGVREGLHLLSHAHALQGTVCSHASLISVLEYLLIERGC